MCALAHLEEALNLPALMGFEPQLAKSSITGLTVKVLTKDRLHLQERVLFQCKFLSQGLDGSFQTTNGSELFLFIGGKFRIFFITDGSGLSKFLVCRCNINLQLREILL